MARKNIRTHAETFYEYITCYTKLSLYIMRQDYHGCVGKVWNKSENQHRSHRDHETMQRDKCVKIVLKMKSFVE